MLEYLLVRPADREEIFANHRCRFLVLDEVHTYRGILGTNIALLVRRLKTHLARARPGSGESRSRTRNSRADIPKLVPVGTSATIKSMSEEGLTHEEVIQLRDTAVQEFFSTLTGVEKTSIRVLGEELQDVEIPAEARYPAAGGPVDAKTLDVANPAAVLFGALHSGRSAAGDSADRRGAPLSPPLGHEPLAHQAADVAQPDCRSGQE